MQRILFELTAEQLAGTPHIVVFGLFVIGAIVSDDVTCIAAGILVAGGLFPLLLLVAACCLGTWLGDVAWFLFGKLVGTAAGKVKQVRQLADHQRTEDARRLLDRYGGYALVITRFTPGLRTPVQLLAGSVYPKPWRGSLYFALATLVYVPLLVGATAIVGDSLQLQSLYERYGLLALFGAAVFAALMLFLIRMVYRFVVGRSAKSMADP